MKSSTVMDKSNAKSVEISSYKEVKLEIPEDSGLPPRKTSLRKNVSDYFVEYTDNTGIHGLKYLGEKGRSVIEKFWWLLIFCICLYKCVNLIVPTLKKWEQNPVIKIKQSKFNMTYYQRNLRSKILDNITHQELRYLADTFLMCSVFPFNPYMYNTHMETIRFFLEVAPPLHEVVRYFPWPDYSSESRISALSPIFTNEGICFSFNMIDRKELFTNITYLPEGHVHHRKISNLSFDHGYAKAAKNVYPRRMISAGRTDALELLLKVNKSDFEALCSLERGFKILFHHPAEVPRFTTRYFQTSYRRYNILVKPDITFTSPDLINYELHRRKCFYSTERKLKFYQLYTQENCLFECLTNYTLQKCKCVNYYMPRELSTKICRLEKSSCVKSTEREFLQQEFFEDGGENASPNCGCLPSCVSINYNAEFYRSEDTIGNNITQLSIFFKDTKFVANERSELFGETDFWTNCGGLLGLFTGLSVVSVAEIIYFLSIRWMCNLRKFRKKFWTGSKRAEAAERTEQ